MARSLDIKLDLNSPAGKRTAEATDRVKLR